MKKVFPILVILFVFTLIIQYVVNFIITEHEVEYSIRTADNSYYIKESFRSINDESFYDFTVRDKNDSFFIFSFNEDLNRQEEVIKDSRYKKYVMFNENVVTKEEVNLYKKLNVYKTFLNN